MDDIASVKLKKEEKLKAPKYILCQKGSKKDVLTGTDNSRAKIVNAAKILDDERILTCSADNSFVYHVTPCYGSYVKHRRTIG